MSDKSGLFREHEVEAIIRDYLQSKGVKVAPKESHGADIRGEDKTGQCYVVEVEGNQKPDGRPLDRSQKYTHFRRAIGQICSRMCDDSAIYAVGVPVDDDYVKDVHATSLARRKLGLHVYLVDSDKNIHEVRPGASFPIDS